MSQPQTSHFRATSTSPSSSSAPHSPPNPPPAFPTSAAIGLAISVPILVFLYAGYMLYKERKHPVISPPNSNIPGKEKDKVEVAEMEGSSAPQQTGELEAPNSTLPWGKGKNGRTAGRQHDDDLPELVVV